MENAFVSMHRGTYCIYYIGLFQQLYIFEAVQNGSELYIQPFHWSNIYDFKPVLN